MNQTRILLFVFLLLAGTLRAQDAQTAEYSKALNNYVQFSNEGVHGMLIVHRMLENFNQEVNKYVDLQSNQLNFYGNKDLPKNIFLDPDAWFYEISPYEWYETALKESKFLPSEDADILNQSLSELKAVMDEVNQIRFDLDELIANNDLTKTENQVKIYAKLERCVDLYDAYFAAKEDLGDNLYKTHRKLINIKSTKFNTQIDLFEKIHASTKGILESLHFGRTTAIPDFVTNLKVQTEQLQQNSIKNRHYDAVLTAAREVVSFGDKYINEPAFQDKYALYGKEYFYYNVEVASSFNRYGSGMVKNANSFIALANPTWLPLLEEPHYYKVIYPKKDIDVPEQETVIDDLPARLKDRNVVVRQQKVLVDEKKLLLEIYDHKQEDGDIISLNFNGNWIMEDKRLQKRPLKMIIELNEEGENYLILHAQNLGEVPPNTIAMRYYYQGVRKIIVLNSDLNESEMIRLEYTGKFVDK